MNVKMKILFLDDAEIRRLQFLKDHPEAVVVATADQCIERLKQGPWDLVSLDHDLAGEIFVDTSRDDCGMEVVRWMGQHRPQVQQVIVHTLNFKAAEKMLELLSLAGYDARHEPWDFS
jgi:hypothetical protein